MSDDDDHESILVSLPISMDKLRESYLRHERIRKVEVIVTISLWLLGCPIICSLRQFNHGTVYNTPDPFMCGLPQYSISASMTGHLPKIWGSIFATLFAILVVQRTANALCPALKLGWLIRYSPLLPNVIDDGKTTKAEQIISDKDDDTTLVARELYKRIQRIETLGYIAGACLVMLVILDAKHFPIIHIILAQIAFASLYRQDWSVGTLGVDYPRIFPTWTSEHGRNFFYIGIGHFVYMMVSISTIQTIYHRGYCDDFNTVVKSASMKLNIDPDTLTRAVSAAIWFSEYVFGVCCIYVQLLEHYELQLWDFVGEMGVVYLQMLPRFSVAEVMQRVFVVDHGSRRELDVLLGTSSLVSQDTKGRLDKEKAS